MWGLAHQVSGWGYPRHCASLDFERLHPPLCVVPFTRSLHALNQLTKQACCCGLSSTTAAVVHVVVQSPRLCRISSYFCPVHDRIEYRARKRNSNAQVFLVQGCRLISRSSSRPHIFWGFNALNNITRSPPRQSEDNVACSLPPAPSQIMSLLRSALLLCASLRHGIHAL